MCSQSAAFCLQLGTRLLCQDEDVWSTAETAREYLDMSPWQLHSKLSELRDVEMEHGCMTAKESMIMWHAKLTDAADERRMESWLPSTPAEGLKGRGAVDREAALVQAGSHPHMMSLNNILYQLLFGKQWRLGLLSSAQWIKAGLHPQVPSVTSFAQLHKTTMIMSSSRNPLPNQAHDRRCHKFHRGLPEGRRLPAI